MKNLLLNAITFVVIGIACSFLSTGCSDEKTLATGETHTVQWFKEHNVERQAVLDECANNPGVLGNLPNCQNAETAEIQLSTGTNGPLNW